jgi:hypothetical protein
MESRIPTADGINLEGIGKIRRAFQTWLGALSGFENKLRIGGFDYCTGSMRARRATGLFDFELDR